ncbi:MAG: hypothetical protein AB8B84_17635 [Granulosicoccus sp.]
MIAEVLQTVLIGIIAASLMGAVIGYIVACIRANTRSNAVIQSLQAEWSKTLADADHQINASARENDALKELVAEAKERANLAQKSEESTQLHSQLLSQRIHSLESQLSSYEEQQIRLQRDFATYKSNKTRELELARFEPESWSQPDQLPVLNKRIRRDDSLLSRSFPATEKFHSMGSSSVVLRNASKSTSSSDLDLSLTEDLEIPALAESELPDSVEELEFEVADWDESGGKIRG